jgi:hypothetical protein
MTVSKRGRDNQFDFKSLISHSRRKKKQFNTPENSGACVEEMVVDLCFLCLNVVGD